MGGALLFSFLLRYCQCVHQHFSPSPPPQSEAVLHGYYSSCRKAKDDTWAGIKRRSMLGQFARQLAGKPGDVSSFAFLQLE